MEQPVVRMVRDRARKGGWEAVRRGGGTSPAGKSRRVGSGRGRETPGRSSASGQSRADRTESPGDRRYLARRPSTAVQSFKVATNCAKVASHSRSFAKPHSRERKTAQKNRGSTQPARYTFPFRGLPAAASPTFARPPSWTFRSVRRDTRSCCATAEITALSRFVTAHSPHCAFVK
jgi:hypothetical protein